MLHRFKWIQNKIFEFWFKFTGFLSKPELWNFYVHTFLVNTAKILFWKTKTFTRALQIKIRIQSCKQPSNISEPSQALFPFQSAYHQKVQWIKSEFLRNISKHLMIARIHYSIFHETLTLNSWQRQLSFASLLWLCRFIFLAFVLQFLSLETRCVQTPNK